jgi:hypothetical protein
MINQLQKKNSKYREETKQKRFVYRYDIHCYFHTP